MQSWVPRQIARVVAALLAGALAQGCLIAAPDELEEPQRVPPRALVGQAFPVVTKIVQTSRRGDATQFNVPFVSTDLGEPIIGRLFLNYPNVESHIGFEQMPAGLTESSREMKIQWSKFRTVPTGCYTITLTIAHADNYSREDLKPIDPDKAAFITWWVAHDVTDPQLISLDECSPSGDVTE